MGKCGMQLFTYLLSAFKMTKQIVVTWFKCYQHEHSDTLKNALNCLRPGGAPGFRCGSLRCSSDPLVDPRRLRSLGYLSPFGGVQKYLNYTMRHRTHNVVLLVAAKMCVRFPSELFVAEVTVSHVESQPVPGGGRAPVAITAVCASNRTRRRNE